MTKQRFASVWDAIEDTPQEAENMRLRSQMMLALRERIEAMGVSQAKAAEILGVTQPRISDLLRGKTNLFGLDALVNMATASGLHVTLKTEAPKRRPSAHPVAAKHKAVRGVAKPVKAATGKSRTLAGAGA
jgi:predicted XRE-type DNA-binding protein